MFGDRLRALGKDVDAERKGDGIVRLLDEDEEDSAGED